MKKRLQKVSTPADKVVNADRRASVPRRALEYIGSTTTPCTESGRDTSTGVGARAVTTSANRSLRVADVED
jgi:hypothetical protein